MKKNHKNNTLEHKSRLMFQANPKQKISEKLTHESCKTQLALELKFYLNRRNRTRRYLR